MSAMPEPGGDPGFTVSYHPVAYIDPHENHHNERIRSEVGRLERLAADYYRHEPGVARKRLSRRDEGNPATAELRSVVPDVESWLALIPTSAALQPLYEPELDRLPNGATVKDEMREWFRNLADASGIRSRAAVMERLLVDELSPRRPATRWLSLACGAAVPIFNAMQRAKQLDLPLPSATLADLDRRALDQAGRDATSRRVAEWVRVVRTNVLARQGFATTNRPRIGGRGGRTWHEQFDAVDAVGILEYLKPDDWTYTYSGVIRTRKILAGAVTFLRNAFACVRSGGLLIVGNILDTHPQLAFTLDVIQWPHIQPRSTTAMLEIFEAAGLRGHVDVYLPSDGVYAVYAIRKA